MKDNKLIAEFMDYKITYSVIEYNSYSGDVIHSSGLTHIMDANLDKDHYEGRYEVECEIVEDEIKYHSDWNWLMPVAEKCRLESRCEHDEDDNWDEIHWALEECNLDKTYNAVVEFIEEYNVQLEKDIKNGLYGEQ